MKNRLGLPEPFVRAVSYLNNPRPPDPHRMGVTTVILPPQLKRLRDEHWNEVEADQDAADRIWAMGGTISHLVLQAAGEAIGADCEGEVSTVVRGVTIVGHYDLLTENEE